MTESIDTRTNYKQSGSNNDDDNPLDLFVVPIYKQEHVDDKFGLLDDDEDNLTLFDLQPVPISDHDLSIFDELEHQCDAVLLSSNLQQNTLASTDMNNSHSSHPMTSTTMINDYERRFQCSLHKLTVPSWYNDTAPSPKMSSKPSIISTTHYSRESHRTPEIVHVRRPHSYRSCRSSLTTSPSPSAHSWHPNHVMDGMNFSLLLPSSSSISSRRHNKYEKGIERVAKSTRWYQPTQFVDNKKNDHIGISKVSTTSTPIKQEKSDRNHYDVPKIHSDDVNNKHSNSIKRNLILYKSAISGLSLQQQSNYLIDGIDFDDVENTSTSKKNNNRNNKSKSPTTNDKQQDHHIKSNESQIMPLANEKVSFGRVELEEVTDEEENDRPSSTNNKSILSTADQIDSDETNTLLERIANDLVQSILTDVFLLKSIDHEDDTNTGVRELSDDEYGLRELDENDMNGTDEFIVFATKAEASDDDDDDDNNNIADNQTPSLVARGSLNRIYTFSRTNDDGGTINSRKMPSNQDSSTPTLMIADKDLSTTNSLPHTDTNQPVNMMVYLDNDDSDQSLPIYRSHIQKRNLNLGRYYDGMMRATNSQLPTHDLRSNLMLNHSDLPLNEQKSSEGVNEETVRKGRLLLDSIPNPIELKNEVQNHAMPVRSILKNTRFVLTDDQNANDQILKIEEQEKISPRKIITTTVTEEYRRIQRKIIEEFTEEPNEEICRDSGYSSNQERINTQQSLIPSVSINDQSPYESLSECYSGYSFIQSDFLIPRKAAPLTSNVSSLQSTTDEAYESEPTISPRSPTMSSSAVTTAAHIHPYLEHEFEYPSPPPPVPDRNLKPAHLRPPPPPTKPRSHKQRNDSTDYSTIKKTEPSPLTVIQHLMSSTSNESASSSTRTMSSRHYCGSLPISNELLSPSSNSSTTMKIDDVSKDKEKRNSKTLNGVNSLTKDDDSNNQQITFTKSPSSSLNKSQSRKPSSTYFDEATNGLAIRLPAPISNGHDSTNKQNLNRTSTSSDNKRADRTKNHRPISENINLDRSSRYETSV